jgi:hypothetical protein
MVVAVVRFDPPKLTPRLTMSKQVLIVFEKDEAT